MILFKHVQTPTTHQYILRAYVRWVLFLTMVWFVLLLLFIGAVMVIGPNRADPTFVQIGLIGTVIPIVVFVLFVSTGTILEFGLIYHSWRAMFTGKKRSD